MSSHPNRSQLNRREWLQVGCSGFLGLGLSSLMAAQAKTRQKRSPKSLIIVYLTGAASHTDTFDMKPDAPKEVRGEFNPIATSVPGIQVGEHLPRMAARAKEYAIIRSFSHRENNHLVATHHVLTGAQMPGAFFDKIASRDDWPCYSSALDHFQPNTTGVPTGVNLPTFLQEGPLVWPGQYAGLLGGKHDPWQITQSPNSEKFRVDSLTLPHGFGVNRLRDRQALLKEVEMAQQSLERTAESQKLSKQQHQAISLLTSGKLSKAFEMHREPEAIRQRYGRHAYGQTLLLARRLIESGARVVQANMGRVQTWDSHSNNFNRLKKDLLPPLDQSVSALLDDLKARGLMEDTLVLMMGEFGRTPKINKNAGRDHWAPCFFGVFAGAGIQGGQVIGKSDKTGAYPITPPYSPDDLGATVYSVLGIDPASEIRDLQNRPVQLNRGKPIQSLFSAG